MDEEEKVERIIDRINPLFLPVINDQDYATVAQLQEHAVRLEEGLRRRGEKTVAAVSS